MLERGQNHQARARGQTYLLKEGNTLGRPPVSNFSPEGTPQHVLWQLEPKEEATVLLLRCQKMLSLGLLKQLTGERDAMGESQEKSQL